MRLGEHDADVCAGGVPLFQGRLDRARVTVCVLVLLEHRTHLLHEVRIPLGVEPGPLRCRWPGNPVVVLHILRNGDLPGLAPVDGVIDLLQQLPAIGNILGRIPVPEDVADIGRRVQAQAVKPVVPQPGDGIVYQVLASQPGRSPAVTPTGSAGAGHPGSGRRRSRSLPAGPAAIELPQNRIRRAEVVVDHVEDHRDAQPVGCAHERLEAIRATVGTLGRTAPPGHIPTRPRPRTWPAAAARPR